MFGGAKNEELEAAMDRLLDIAGKLFDDDPIPPASKSTLQLFQAAMNSFAGDQGDAVWQTVGRPLLTRQLERMNNSQLMRLLAGEGGKDWLKLYPHENVALAPFLVHRLQSILDELGDNPSLLPARVPVLSAVREFIPVELRARVLAWDKVLALLKDLRSMQRKQPQKFENLIVLDREVGNILMELVRAFAKALNGRVFVDQKKGDLIVNKDIIYGIGQELLGNCFLEEAKVFRVQMQNLLPKH
jgi:hypothetical protein